MEALAKEGKAPAFVAVGLEPGLLIPENNGSVRTLRTDFDHATAEIPNFVADELIPEIKRVTGLNISDNPDMRMTSGGSTGGAIAFSSCWNRNDQFRRGYLSSPSVHSLSGGAELVNYVTKCEPRPIRSYISVGKYESLGYWGHNVEAAVSLARCLDWNNYPYEYHYLDGKVHTWGMGVYEEQLRAMEYLWRDWDKAPVATGEYCKPLAAIVEKGTGWEAIPKSELPEHEITTIPGGRYEAEGNTIWYLSGEKKERVADGFGQITGLAVSCDGAFLYITDACTRGIYCMTIGKDGTLTHCRTLSAQIHLPPTATRLGAAGLCSDTADNLYLATEWGVQITPAANDLRVILPLPGDLPVDAVILHGQTLYAVSGEQCFKRLVKQSAKQPDKFTTPIDLGGEAMDFGAWTNDFQPKLDAMAEDEKKKYLWEDTFFYPHPVL